MSLHNRRSDFSPENRLERYFQRMENQQQANNPADRCKAASSDPGRTTAVIKLNQRRGLVDLMSEPQYREFNRYFNSLITSFMNFGEHHSLDEDINLDHVQVQQDIKRYAQATREDASSAEFEAGLSVKRNLIACLSKDLFGHPLALIKDRDFRSFASQPVISLAELKDFLGTLYSMKN